MLHKIHNVVRGVIQRHGTAGMRTKLWNAEFQTGHWDFMDSTFGHPIYRTLEKHLDGGKILDLGCGTGNTGNELDPNSYSTYVGVDLSAVALAKAEARAKVSGRQEKNHYITGDIGSYQPEERFDVILFRETIFYIPSWKVTNLLQRLSANLSPAGVFIVRMCDRLQYGKIVDLITRRFSIVERCEADDGAITLVFRPNDAVGSS